MDLKVCCSNTIIHLLTRTLHCSITHSCYKLDCGIVKGQNQDNWCYYLAKVLLDRLLVLNYLQSVRKEKWQTLLMLGPHEDILFLIIYLSSLILGEKELYSLDHYCRLKWARKTISTYWKINKSGSPSPNLIRVDIK